MKIKIILPALSLLSIISMQVSAQWINSITLTPANPTSNDTVRIIVNSNFPAGGCDQATQFVQVNGNMIDAYSIHCLGIATFICNDTDTFLIGQLPAGSFTFRIQLDMGSLPAPCTPGIIPTQTDSLTFSVTPETALGEQIASDEVLLSPNPASDFISLHTDVHIFPTEVQVFSVDGKKSGSYFINGSDEKIDIRHLSPGIYHVKIIPSDRLEFNMPLIIHR